MAAKKKNNRAPKAHHGWWIAIFLAGCIIPPLAVLMRFGVGRDFFINILFTLCGYFPSHGHNFYLQNIRNNQGRGRTPKWAIKHGLIQDTSKEARGKRDWVHRYNERLPSNAYDESGGFEDEFGNPVANGNANPPEAGSSRRITDPTLLPTEEGEDDHLQQSARNLERYDSHDSNSTTPSTNRRRGTKAREDFSDLPGAGDRRSKHTKKSGIRGLVTGNKSKGSDRFARMEAERERFNQAGADDLGGIDWLDEGRSTNSRLTGTDPLSVSNQASSDQTSWKSRDDVPEHQF